MIDKIALALVVIGGLNWGSIGLFGFDFVGAIFGGQDAVFSRIIFSIVGLAALWSWWTQGTDEQLRRRF